MSETNLKWVEFCSEKGASHYKAVSPQEKSQETEPDKTWKSECPVCDGEIITEREELQSETSFSESPTYIQQGLVCCQCGNITASGFKGIVNSTAMVYPDWIKEQYEDENVVKSLSGCKDCEDSHWFVRVSFVPKSIYKDSDEDIEFF